MDTDEETVTFEDLGLDEYTLKAVEKKGFITPSPIQVLAIPRLLNGESNLIARARTGTGKTAAFGLPIIQSIKEKTNNVQALILEPTRELAMQTCEEMKSFASGDFPRTTVLYGGASYATQIRDLKRGCEIVVGSPGRIKDHIEKKTLDLSKIKYFILDEGDEMLDMGFIDDIREIFEHSNIDARILLFSATMPAPILKIAGDFMGEYDIIEEEKVVDEALLIDQKYWMIKESDKIEGLVRIIDMAPDFYGLVFTMTKMDADRVCKELDLRGYESDALHGDIMQNQREKVLERFRSKKTRILVATDVAARGIDISGLSHVINYSLPYDTATYVHRIGRTGRAGTTGTAITFVCPNERKKLGYFVKNVQRATKNDFTEEKIPTVKEVLSIKEARLIDELKNKLFKELPAVTEEELPAENTVTKELLPVDDKYVDLAQELCKEQDAEQVLAGVLSIMYGQKLSPKHYGRISVSELGPKGDQMRLYISLGKKDGYRAREIAQYFSELLHIPGRMVDDIDVAQQFSLVSLPIASAKKALEMSKNNKKIPHMHVDSKEEGRGSRKSKSRDFEKDIRGEKTEKKERSRSAEKKGREKGSRPNVHNQTERKAPRKPTAKNVGAAGFVKGKAERF
ncbi:MAG: DEAD/DEAH box helicase [Treponema sp.]|nr:DEAD/DEAH box helicase [Treponema sp.]